jgi:proteasome assembly chaperone (PAC2) family protein
MAGSQTDRETWLVAAWPGMGNVAIGAAGYLLVKLGAQMISEMPTREVFDIQQIEVHKGLVKAARFPRNMFFGWTNPKGPRDLLIFLGEAQPSSSGYAFCHKLLDFAEQKNVKRLFTFAAMASQLHPSKQPRVFGAATDGEGLKRLSSAEATTLDEGQVSGLNGVLLAAGAERRIPGICLLGELPYFAAAVPNPKASMAVLKVFATMAEIEIDFEDIRKQAEAVDQALVQLLEKMQEAARQGDEPFASPEFTPPTESPESQEKEMPENKSQPPAKKPLDYATRRRIDALFQAALQDRSKAFQLKQELDRLGVFEEYENRFLDLFRKGD